MSSEPTSSSSTTGKYWDETEQYSAIFATDEQKATGKPRLTKEIVLFAQMRGVILHIGTFAPFVREGRERWQYWNGVDAMEVFYSYAHECGYVQLLQAYQALGEEAYQRFIQYWNDCVVREI